MAQRNKQNLGAVPVPPDMPGVKGVFLGGCVKLGVGVEFRIVKRAFPKNTRAHAHLKPDEAVYGWVCFMSPHYIKSKALRMHELAHIMVGRGGHSDAWRDAMKQLGQKIPLRYR